MKLRSLLTLAIAFGLTLASIEAKTPTPSPAPATAVRELAIVVVEPITLFGGMTPFDYVDVAFREVVDTRKWSVKLIPERFAANTPDNPTEIRIFLRSVSEEWPTKLVLRGWVTFTDRGKRHDFGLMKFTVYTKLIDRGDEGRERLYRGFAEHVADKIEPLLFPKP